MNQQAPAHEIKEGNGFAHSDTNWTYIIIQRKQIREDKTKQTNTECTSSLLKGQGGVICYGNMNDENHSFLKGSIPITAKNCTLKLISNVMIQPVDSILWHSYTVGVRDRSSYPHCCEAQLTCWWELSAQPSFCLSIHCSVSLIGLSAPVCPECTHTHTHFCKTHVHMHNMHPHFHRWASDLHGMGVPQCKLPPWPLHPDGPLQLYERRPCHGQVPKFTAGWVELSPTFASPPPSRIHYNSPRELRVGL